MRMSASRSAVRNTIYHTEKGADIMASVIADEEREKRYFKLRKQKKRYERYYDKLMIFAVIGLLFDIAAEFDSGILYGVMIGGGLLTMLRTAVGLAGAVMGVAAVYQKRPRFTLLTILVCIIGLALFLSDNQIGILNALVSGVRAIRILLFAFMVRLDIKWNKLTQEEGFPHFCITYKELSDRTKRLDRHARIRAVESGTRHVRTDSDNSMGDLLDEAQDTPVSIAVPMNYHERSRDSQGHENARNQTVGKMDELT